MSDRRDWPVEAGTSPIVSVIMANHSGGRYIAQSIRSVLGQSMTELELIVSDDASGDDSIAVVESLMAHDARLRLLTTTHNGGPAACRNRALAVARGAWIAIVDSDDVIHAERLERLLAIASTRDVDIVADDLLYFHEDGSPSALLLPPQQEEPLEPQAAAWILAGRQGSPALGYLKPMIRAAALGETRYDEGLRIGEDYDLVLRLLLGGARMLVVPEPWYLYRRHSQSTSHRLRGCDIEAMIASQERLAVALDPVPPQVAAAFATRLSDLRMALAFAQLIEALKRRRLAQVAALIARRPSLLVRLVGSVREHFSPSRLTPPTLPAATVLSLGAGSGDEAIEARAARIAIPPYEAMTHVPAGGGARRETWRRISDLGRGDVVVQAEDPAGVYAAGFAENGHAVAPPHRGGLVHDTLAA